MTTLDLNDRKQGFEVLALSRLGASGPGKVMVRRPHASQPYAVWNFEGYQSGQNLYGGGYHASEDAARADYDRREVRD